MGDPRFFDRITRADVRVLFLAILAVAAAFLLDGWANFHLHGGQQ